MTKNVQEPEDVWKDTYQTKNLPNTHFWHTKHISDQICLAYETTKSLAIVSI